MIGFCISEDVEQNGESGSQPGAEQQFKETSFNWFLNFLSPGRDCWCPTKPFFFSRSHAPVSYCGGRNGVALFISPAISLVSLTERVEVVTAGTPPGKQEHPPGTVGHSNPAWKRSRRHTHTHTSEIFLKQIMNRSKAAGTVWAEIKCCRRSGLRSSTCSFSLLIYCLATRPSHRNCFKLISQIKEHEDKVCNKHLFYSVSV